MRREEYIQPEAGIVEADSCPVMASSSEAGTLPEIARRDGEVW